MYCHYLSFSTFYGWNLGNCILILDIDSCILDAKAILNFVQPRLFSAVLYANNNTLNEK